MRADRGAPFSATPRPPRVLIPRRRLEAELDRASNRSLTVLVAPAGSGKTAALAGWAADGDRAHWFVAEPGAPAVALAAAMLSAAGAPAGGRSVTTGETVRRLQHADGPPEVLVVDDAQHLGPDSWELLDAVVTLAPDRVRMVLASRRDTPLPTVSLELSDALTVLRGDVLRFDDDDAALLVAAHAPDATAEDTAALQGRAHGWAAALVLGARSLAAAPDRAAARSALSHTDRPVLDYLLGEVFATMPASTRHVLQCTADEPVVTPAVARLLSGDPEAATHLSDIAADGILVTAYDSGGETAWSYHPLLRELLRRQVASDGPDHALAVAAHARAARHHALHGPPETAVRHAIAAGDHTLLVELLVERGPVLISGGHEDLVAASLRSLPDGTAESQPALLGVTALLLRSIGDREEAVRVATLTSWAARVAQQQEASAGAARPTAAVAALLADAAILNCWLARLGWHDCTEAITEGRWLLGDAADVAGSLEPVRLSWLLHELAVVETWVGDFDEANRHVDEALLNASAVGNHRLNAAALADRALLQLLDGQFQTSAETSRACLAAAEAAGRREDDYLARSYLALGWAAFYDLRLEESAAWLAEVRRLEEHAFDPLVSALALVLDARLVAELGDVAQARQMLSTSPPTPDPAPPYLEAVYAVVRAHWAVVDGDLAAAAAQLGPMRAAGWETSTATFEAVLAALAGDRRGALVRLDLALSLPTRGEQLVCAAFAAAYKARLHLDGGRLQDARAAMLDALTRAAPQKLLHPLLASAAAGPDYDALLDDLAGSPDAHTFAAYAAQGARRYARRYPGLGSRGTPAGTRSVPPPVRRQVEPGRQVPPSLPPQPLTGREAEVLRELALGGSYHDVARVLYVTDNTVKTHVSALYRKLGVERRADALRRARELGLI